MGIRIRLGDSTENFKEEAECAKNVETDLKPFSDKESNCLINNGFDATRKNFEIYCEDIDYE